MPLADDAAHWQEARGQLGLLRRLLEREAHVLLNRPQEVASHLHNMLLLEEGEDGAAAPLLDRARRALEGRAWLQLVRRPPLGRSMQRAALVHGGTVWALAWSPDGHVLASAGDDGVVRVWRPERGLLVGTLEAQAGPANALCWSPDGELLAAGHDDGTVRLWQAGDLRQLAALPAQRDAVLALAWSPDGKLLAAGCADGSVWLWTARTRRCRKSSIDHTGRVHAVAWSPDATSLATGSAGGEVWLRDRAGTVFARLEHPSLQESLSELLRGEGAFERMRHATTVFGLAWSPDGRALAAARRIGAVSLWHPASGETVEPSIIAGAGVTTVAWSPDGALLAYAGEGLIHLVVPAMTPPQAAFPFGHGATVFSLAWAPHGELLASAGEDGTVRLWDTRDRALATPTGAQIPRGKVFGTAWSGDGALLGSGDANCTACLWDAATGELAGEVRKLAGPVLALASAPGHGVVLAPMGTKTEAPVLLWSKPAGAPRPWLEVDGPVFALALSPDGLLLAAGDICGTVWVYEVPAGRVRAVFPPTQRADDAAADPRPTPVRALSWTPDGRLLAATGSSGSAVWSLETGKLMAELEIPGGKRATTATDLEVDGTLTIGIVPAALSWSPDGRLLAASAENGSIRLWLPGGGRPVMELRGHESTVTALAWSPNARFLASASVDLTLRVWEVADGTGRAIAQCLSPPRALRFAGDDILQAADDGAVTENRPLLYRFMLRGFDR